MIAAGGEAVKRLADANGATVSWSDAIGDEDSSRPPDRHNLDIDLASLIYTSGSTGEPKGIMLTHRNMLAAATSITAYLENREDDVILDALPLSFDYGLYQVIMAFRMGATVVLERSFAYPAQVLDDLVQERVTGFPGVPTMFATLAGMKDLEAYDFSSVRYVSNTAAAIAPQAHRLHPPHVLERAVLLDVRPDRVQACAATCRPRTWIASPIAWASPFPTPSCGWWTRGARESDLASSGELVVRGATVMKGYWNKPEATAERLRPGPLPGEEVLYTGDLCRLDEDGYLYFVARMDEVIKSRGEKVAPREVEAALLSIPGISEAAVAGIPDTILGQAIKAFVVLQDEARLSPAQIRLECQARLEPHMVPAEIAIVPRLPRTTSMKVDLKALL